MRAVTAVAICIYKFTNYCSHFPETKLNANILRYNQNTSAMNVQKLIREGSPLCFRFQYTSSRMTLITVSPEEQSERQRCAAVPSNIFFFNFAWFTVRRTSDGLIALLWVWGDWWALMTLLGLCMLQIRKRRPTPASLVIMNEHVPPGKCQHTF